MGIIQVGVEAAKGVLADQWREYFYCPAMDADVLATKGVNRKAKRNFNTKGSDNLISNGSIIAVAEGQCMLIVDQGAIVEVCGVAGEFVYDSSTEPTIFYGDLSDNILNSLKQFGKRVSFGGDTAKDQRIYFINTKEILGNKYGTASPVPFRVVDQNIGLDIDIAIRCHGEYSYRITDPVSFYKNVCGNIEEDYYRSSIDSQLKSEMLTALQPAFGKISAMGIRYSALPGHTMELAEALNEVLSEKWGGRYGIEISAIGVNSVKAPEEDEEMIKELQRNAVFRNPNMAAAHMVSAQADAMRSAAANEATGPMMAFAGLNMATNAGGMNAADLFAMGQQPQYQQQMQPQYQQAQSQQTVPAQSQPTAEVPKNSWKCACGHEGNTGKFCMECGTKKPEGQGFWTCGCGTQNKGKFCTECGTKKPTGVPQYKCDKCGWEPADPKNPPKFCPECGDPFGDEDIAK